MAKPWEVAAQGGQNTPWARASENAARREAAPAKAREAFEASRNLPESVAARERDAQHPVRRYLGEWGDALKNAFGNLYDSPLDIGRIPERTVGTLEGLTSALTGAASIVPGAFDLAATNLSPDPRNPEQSLMTAMEKYTYSPRTETGKEFNEAVGATFKPLGDVLAPDTVAAAAEDYGVDPETAARLGDQAGPLLGTIPVGAAAPTAGRVAGRVARGIAPKTSDLLAQQTPPELPGPKLPKAATEPSEVARAADIKIPPSAKPGAKGTALESLVGSPQAQAKGSLRNRPTINRHARADLNMPEKAEQKFSYETFRKLEEPEVAIYDEVVQTLPVLALDEQLRGAIDNVGAAQRDNPLLKVAPAVQELQELLAQQGDTLKTSDVRKAVRDWRFKAQKLFKSVDDPAKYDQAAAYMQAADGFEAAMERQAAAVGKGDLGPRFRGARKRLAKIYDYETAMVDGNIDIQVLTRMKEKGRPLSGRAAMLADLGRWFAPETQQASMVRIPTERMPPWWRTALGRAAQVFARKPVDEILFSERYQRQFGDVDPNPGPGSPLGAYFDAPEPVPPAPRRAGPEGSGSVDFEGSPNVPPQAALRPGERIEFARDESGDFAIPQAEGRVGDLTAAQAPAPEGLPFEASPEVPAVQGRRAPTPADADLAAETGFFPGAEVPPNAALVEWLTDQPIERRRAGGREEYPVPDRTVERARVLEGGGMNVDAMIGDLLARFPGLADELRGDTVGNRDAIMSWRAADRGEPAPARTPETPSRREGDVPVVNDASIQATIDTLTELGFTPDEIQIILSRGRE